MTVATRVKCKLNHDQYSFATTVRAQSIIIRLVERDIHFAPQRKNAGSIQNEPDVRLFNACDLLPTATYLLLIGPNDHELR